MGSLLWYVAALIVLLWVLGFFVAHVGSIIHLLLVIAVIAVIYNLTIGRNRID